MPSALIAPYRILNRRSIAGLRITHFAQKAHAKVTSHYHDHGTLCVLLRGLARDHFSSGPIEYRPGAAIYRPPGERHSHEFGSDGVIALVIEIPPSQISRDPTLRSLSELRITQNSSALVDAAQLLACLTNPACDLIDLEEPCFALLTAFNRADNRARTPDGLERVRAFLDESASEKRSLLELGAIAGLHPAYLVNAFRRRFGCTIGQYHRRRRLDHVVKQVWNSHRPLAEIALNAGFYDQSHCTNEIRRHLRLTPRRLRAMMATPGDL